MLQRLLDWDRQTFIYFNNLGIERFDAFWETVTDTVTWIPLFLLFLILFFLKFPKKEAALKSLTVVALSCFILLATYLTKNYFGRLRPNNDHAINMLIRILRSPTDYSFISGHAASSFSVTTLVVLFLHRQLRWAWLFYLWPVLFSFSRIYVGVHYPSDIMAGALIGLVSACLFYHGYNRFIVRDSASGHPG